MSYKTDFLKLNLNSYRSESTKESQKKNENLFKMQEGALTSPLSNQFFNQFSSNLNNNKTYNSVFNSLNKKIKLPQEYLTSQKNYSNNESKDSHINTFKKPENNQKQLQRNFSAPLTPKNLSIELHHNSSSNISQLYSALSQVPNNNKTSSFNSNLNNFGGYLSSKIKDNESNTNNNNNNNVGSLLNQRKLNFEQDNNINNIYLTSKNFSIPNYEQTKHSSKKNGVIKSYAANTNQGLVRNYNEDRVSIILNITKPNTKNDKIWPKCSFFGIYDGHGGVFCADFLKDNLHQFVTKTKYNKI